MLDMGMCERELACHFQMKRQLWIIFTWFKIFVHEFFRQQKSFQKHDVQGSQFSDLSSITNRTKEKQNGVRNNVFRR